MDSNRHWFKSRLGIEFTEAPRPISMCSYCFLSESSPIFVIEDTHSEGKYATNPLVTGFPFLRFYAGASLFVDGVKVGVLCVIDQKPRYDFGVKQQKILVDLAHCVTDLVLIRRRQMLETRYHCVPLHQSVLSVIREPLSRVTESKQWIAELLKQMSTTDSFQKVNNLLTQLYSVVNEFSKDLRYLETIVGAATHVMRNLLQTDVPSSSVTLYKQIGFNLAHIRTEQWWSAFLRVFSFAKVSDVSPVCLLTAERIQTHPDLLLLVCGALLGHLVSSHSVVGVVIDYKSISEVISAVPSLASEQSNMLAVEGMMTVDISYAALDINRHSTITPRFVAHGMISAIRHVLHWVHGFLIQDAYDSHVRIYMPCKLVHKRSSRTFSEEELERALNDTSFEQMKQLESMSVDLTFSDESPLKKMHYESDDTSSLSDDEVMTSSTDEM